MALPKYFIGEHEFTFLSGPPDKPSQKCEVISRVGTNSVGVYRLGRFGEPFMLRSEVDVADRAAALAEFDEYRESIAKDPVNVKWADLDSESPRDFKVIVLDVRLSYVPMSYVACVGGINVEDGVRGVWLACDWTLVSLDNIES